MSRMLEAVKHVLAYGPLHMVHTGDSTIENGWDSNSAYTHFKIMHPNGEIQHVSYDHDEDTVIKHRKDPTRKDYGAIYGRSELNYGPSHHTPQEIEDMKNKIRKVIKPRTKVQE